MTPRPALEEGRHVRVVSGASYRLATIVGWTPGHVTVRPVGAPRRMTWTVPVERVESA